MHCTRLYETATAILERDPAGAPTALKFLQSTGLDGLKPLVRNEISTALSQVRGGAGAADYQVTLLLTWETVGPHTPTGRGFDVFTFVQPLLQVQPMVSVEARAAKRSNPTIKSAQWVNDRQHLEELQRLSGVNEIVMFDDDGSITEGLQTNFFAVDAGGALLTAPNERVLSGTVRKVVLELAQQHGFTVRLEAPNINNLQTWESCFICSTSRLVKPIAELTAPDLAESKRFPGSSSVAHRIEALVMEAVRGNSEALAN